MHRRVAPRLTSWLFVVALLLKSAVPMLAGAAAGLQGRATAEVCDVYGVDMSIVRARPAVASPAGGHHDERAQPTQHAQHAHAQHAQGDGSSPADGPSPAHGPASRVGHGGEHCALSALAFAPAAVASGVVAAPAVVALASVGASSATPVVDPVARWAARLRHGPPASA